MARLRRGLSAPVAGSGGPQPVVNVVWGGLPYPAIWQQIGAFDLPPGNLAISLYAGPQRRNGWGDVTGDYLVSYPPNWTQQYPIVTPGTQRAAGSVAQQGPGAYRVWKMRKAVTAAQIQQAGAQVLPFMNAQYARTS